MISLNVKIRNRLLAVYVVTDLLTSSLAIVLFNLFRWNIIEFGGPFSTFYKMPQVWGGQICFPLMLMLIYWLSGYYNNVYRRSRAQEAIATIMSSAIGALIIFFSLLLTTRPGSAPTFFRESWSQHPSFSFVFTAAAI